MPRIFADADAVKEIDGAILLDQVGTYLEEEKEETILYSGETLLCSENSVLFNQNYTSNDVVFQGLEGPPGPIGPKGSMGLGYQGQKGPLVSSFSVI